MGNQYHVARLQTKFCRRCPNHIKDWAGLLRRVNKQYANNIGKPGPSQSCSISSCFLLVSAAWPPLGARLPMLGTLPDLLTCIINFEDRSSLLIFLPPENRWLWPLSHVNIPPYWNSCVCRTYGCRCDGTDIASQTQHSMSDIMLVKVEIGQNFRRLRKIQKRHN